MQYGRGRGEITLTPLKMSYGMHLCTIYSKKKKQQQQQICCREQFLQLFINPTHQLVCNQYTILLCKGVGTC